LDEKRAQERKRRTLASKDKGFIQNILEAYKTKKDKDQIRKEIHQKVHQSLQDINSYDPKNLDRYMEKKRTKHNKQEAVK